MDLEKLVGIVHKSEPLYCEDNIHEADEMEED